jgi:hypothetical protein
MDWSLIIENCGMSLRCEQDYRHLIPTDFGKIRVCRKCFKRVFITDNYEEQLESVLDKEATALFDPRNDGRYINF